MTKSVQKITLSTSRDIPFNKLVLSQANVRRVKAGISIEELAEDIVRRTLLQSLSVRPVLDAEGAETGMFEVPAGGRRFRALQLLVKQKRMSKTQPVPCVVRQGGLAEEDSLAENVQRAPLHPLDQFRAFAALRDKGLNEEEIATRFFVNPSVVKQRLRLVAVSEKLLDIYAEDGMTLEQLMAFTVISDHARQEQVWDTLSRSHNKEPYAIRRQLTEGAVRASDKRARFVGIAAYEAAGGLVMRDLFQHDDGGWLQDPALLDRLLTEKLQTAAERLRAEGWKWIAAAADFPYGHTAGLRRLTGETVALRAARRCRPNMTGSRTNTPEPTSCPTTSIGVSARSRVYSRRSTSGLSSMIPPRLRGPAFSSASMAPARCGLSGVTSEPRTRRRRARSRVMVAKRQSIEVRTARSSVPSSRSAARLLNRWPVRTTMMA
jgi:ParB family chromosome partitioning protein